nr:MFS transporter [Rubrivivax gelatinosus]
MPPARQHRPPTAPPSGARWGAAVPSEAAAAPSPPAGSAWEPFRSRVFAVVWTAVLLGSVGTWIRDVGAGWLMTSLSASATAVAMVQAATTLPLFLLALPAGALADSVDRRRLLLGVHALMAAISLGMGLLTRAGLMTPTLLVLGLLLAGICTALVTPVLQSLTVLLVPRPQLRAAIALNSMGLNVSRAIGPALGGLLLALAGTEFNFFADALSYLFVIAAFWWWKGASARAATGTPEQLGAALRAGLRFAWHAPALRRSMLRSASFFVFASAYWALLPLIARQQLGGSPAFYGLLLGCVGAGAVLAALGLPALRRRLSAEATVRCGTAASVAVLVLLASTRQQALAAATMVLAGAAWIAVLSTANVIAQTSLPDWVRGRGLALYLSVFYGAMTLGSFVWGQTAEHAGVPAALLAAAGVGVLALALAWLRPLPDAEPDLTPSLHWPEPALSPAMAASLVQDRGPVMVTVEYRVATEHTAGFLAAVHAFAPERRRDGAYAWGIYEDAADSGRFVESFLLPSWLEHQRQHRRVSQADAALQARVQAFHLGPQAPRVQHFVAPARGRPAVSDDGERR